MRILVILHDGILAGWLRLRSSPEGALLESGACLEIASRLRTRFLFQQCDILLERQGGAIQSLDRELLDPRGALPDIKLQASRLHHTGHALACHLSADGVLLVIDAHGAVGLHRAGKGLLVHSLEPRVRIDRLWHSRQCRELGAGHTRRMVARGARLVGSLVIVMRQKGQGRLGDLFAGAWEMDEASTRARASDESARRRS
jgi:hypothetical protein